MPGVLDGHSHWRCMRTFSYLGKAAVQALTHDTALAQKFPDEGGPLQVCPVPEWGQLQRPVLRHAHELHMGACWSGEVLGSSLYHICGTRCGWQWPQRLSYARAACDARLLAWQWYGKGERCRQRTLPLAYTWAGPAADCINVDALQGTWFVRLTS